MYVAGRYLKEDPPLNVLHTTALFASASEAWYISTRSGWDIEADFRNENILHAIVYI